MFKSINKKRRTKFRSVSSQSEVSSFTIDKTPWKGIGKVLYGSKWNNEREKYREIIRPRVRVFLYVFNHGELDHLERFLPIHHFCNNSRESDRKYLSEHLTEVETWAKMTLEDFKEWIQNLARKRLRRLDEELASLGNEKDLQSLNIKWRIKSRSKKLRAVRQKRFGF